MHDIPILMLHTVNDHPQDNPMGELSVSSKGLDAYLKVLKQWKYQMISMDDLLNDRYDPKRNFIVLTFDDGYKDNLTVALPVLKKYGARATIFVNPAYVSPESDDSDWGFMTWEEVKQAEESGVFDIQAHTMTHEFVFTSEKVVDYYTPDKFHKYYWLAWMLYPDAPNHWNGTANRYRDMIPTGYPVFEYGRRISGRKFIPEQAYVEHLIEKYKGVQQEEYTGSHGTYETEEDYQGYIRWEIEDCKKILEDKLNKKIHTLCFPGGGYTDFALDIAKKCGYQCYMTASRMRVGNNNDHLENVKKGNFCGMNRTSFSLIHPGILPDAFFDYWVAKLSLGTYQNKQPYRTFKKLMSKVFHA